MTVFANRGVPHAFVFCESDGAHASEVRDNVELVAGPDDWHGEDFSLPH